MFRTIILLILLISNFALSQDNPPEKTDAKTQVPPQTPKEQQPAPTQVNSVEKPLQKAEKQEIPQPLKPAPKVEQPQLTIFEEKRLDYMEWGLFLNGLGFLVIFCTLWVGIANARTARKSAETAFKALSQNRAWVLLKEAGEGFYYKSEDRVAIFISNFGKVPAANVRLKKASMGLEGEYSLEDIPKDYEFEWSTDELGVIAPSVEIAVHLGFTDIDREELNNSGNRLVHFFEIDYDAGYGISGKTRQTVEIRKVDVTSESDFKFLVTPVNNNDVAE